MPFMEAHPRRFSPVPMLVGNFVLITTATLGALFRPDKASVLLGAAAIAFAGMQLVIHQCRTHSEERDRYLRRQYDLFERRWKIYAEVRDFLDAMVGGIMSPAGVQAREMSKSDPTLRQADEETKTMSIMLLTKVLAQQNLRPLMVEAHFLFEQDLNGYLEELNNQLRCADRDRAQAGHPSRGQASAGVA